MSGTAAEIWPKSRAEQSDLADSRAVGLIERAAVLMLGGARPAELARSLKVPHPTACKLYEAVFEQVWTRVRDKYTPEVLATMKDELVETLVEEIQNCREAVAKTMADAKPSTRSYTHLNSAVKMLSAMLGFNAPLQSMSLNVEARILDPAKQQALVSDPEYCRLVMAAEERERAIFSHRQGHVAGQVRGIGQQGEVVLRPAPEPAQPEDDGRGDGQDPPPGDLHAAEARQVGVPVEVFPGLVPGHLPRSEGDLGRV